MAFKRLEYIDVAKGLGIAAVVVGHICEPTAITNVLYLFHLPLFFFISGFLFSITDDHSAFVIKKIKQFSIPYISFLFFSLIYQVQYSYHKNHSLDLKSFIGLVWRALFGGRWLYGWGAVFWFISVLLLVLVIMNYLIPKLKRPHMHILMIAFIILSYVNSYYFQTVKIPLNANVVFAAAPIFYLGYLSKKLDVGKYDIVFTLVTIIGVILTLKGILPRFDMKNVEYGVPVLSFLVTLSSVFLIIRFSFFIDKVFPWASILIASFGKASILIMYLHQPVQILFRALGVQSNLYLISIALILPYLLYLFANNFQILRVLFIGSSKDFDDIVYKQIKISQ
jgi:fucose 4-O-acetylase-like acetyltransferase